jgi:hypothetical protein
MNRKIQVLIFLIFDLIKMDGLRFGSLRNKEKDLFRITVVVRNLTDRGYFTITVGGIHNAQNVFVRGF